MLVDLGVLGQDRHGNEITGKAVEKALDQAGIHCQQEHDPLRPQAADDDQRDSPGHAGGDDRGLGAAEFEQIGRWIAAHRQRPAPTPTLHEQTRQDDVA